MVYHASGSHNRSKFLWSVLWLVAVLSCALAACGGGPTPAASTQSNSSQSSASGTTSTVTIAEKTGTHDIYSFDPQTITIKAGTTVKWVNHSDENHLLASKTAGVFTASSIVHRSGSSDTTYQVVFNTPGTYPYTSTLVQRLGNQPEGMTSSAMGTIIVIA